VSCCESDRDLERGTITTNLQAMPDCSPFRLAQRVIEFVPRRPSEGLLDELVARRCEDFASVKHSSIMGDVGWTRRGRSTTCLLARRVAVS
jgi:hypothetical protein